MLGDVGWVCLLCLFDAGCGVFVFMLCCLCGVLYCAVRVWCLGGYVFGSCR